MSHRREPRGRVAVRRARKARAAPLERFTFRTCPRPISGHIQDPDWRNAVRSLFGEAAAHLLRPRPPPSALPTPEEEAVGPDNSTPPSLPLVQAAWGRELERQALNPFVAGTVRRVALRWSKGPPKPPHGMFFAWGPALRLDVLPEAERVEFGELLVKDLCSGALRPVSPDLVDAVTPVFVAHHPVTRKPRLVHDLRAINVLLAETTVVYPRAADGLGRGGFAAKLDISSAFKHVAVTENDSRVLAFQVDGLFFRWSVLPFGCSQSPELFGDTLALTLRRIPAGVPPPVAYVDDLLVVASSPAGLDTAVVAVLQTLANDGWYVALEKLFAWACAVIPFLGVLLDLTAGILRVSRVKAMKVQALCRVILSRRVVSLRELQRLGGLLAFIAAACPMARLARKGIDAATAEAEGLPGRTVGVKGALRDDVRFWEAFAPNLPRFRVPVGDGPSLAVCTDAAGGSSPGWGAVAWPARQKAPDVSGLLGPPSSYALTVRQVQEHGAIVMAAPFPPAWTGASSGALEVGALILTLSRLRVSAAASVQHSRIFWYTDSLVAVGAVKAWRAQAAGLIRALRQLFELALFLDCIIIPHWVSREAGWQPVADWLSKARWVPDTAEWAIPPDVRADLFRQAGWTPSVDLFAAPINAACKDFYTQFPTPGAYTDCMAGNWSGMRGWAFPPFSLAASVLLKLAAARDARLIVVIPQETAVPCGLIVRLDQVLPPTALIDTQGRQATAPCSRPLRVLDVQSPT